MKKIEKYIYVLIIVILVGVVASTTTYIIMKNDDNKSVENNKDNKDLTIKDEVKLQSININSDKVMQTFQINLNGKSKVLKIEFNYEQDYTYEIKSNRISGKFNNITLYDFWKNDEYVYNGETSEITVTHNYSKEELLTEKEIKNTFNENNFQFIEGTDNKKYLIVKTYQYNSDLDLSELLVFNDELKLISNFSSNESPDYENHNGFVINSFRGNIPCEFANNINPFYTNTFNIIGTNSNDKSQYVKLENNKIYYLAPVLDKDDTDSYTSSGVLEERVYTINNDKLEYEVINKYKIIGVCQQL